MDARAVKSKLTSVTKWTKFWRKVLAVDPKWEIKVVADMDEDEEAWASLDCGAAEYWKVDLNVHKNLAELEGREYAVKAGQCVLHELLHLTMWQYTSFASNIAGPKLQPELTKLEEQVVQQLEHVLWKLVDTDKELKKYEVQTRSDRQRNRGKRAVRSDGGQATEGVPAACDVEQNGAVSGACKPAGSE